MWTQRQGTRHKANGIAQWNLELTEWQVPPLPRPPKT